MLSLITGSTTKRFEVKLPIRLFSGFVLLFALTAGSAQASTIYSGVVSGIFTNPVLSGEHINISGGFDFVDNTNTAVYSGTGTNQVQWGTFPVDQLPPGV